jgi:hypothetical protein
MIANKISSELPQLVTRRKEEASNLRRTLRVAEAFLCKMLQRPK